MTKIVFTDLDGTIVHRNNISQETKNTVSYLKENNIKFSIATGRHHTAVEKFVNELQIVDPVICGNGAYIFNPITKEILSVSYMDASAAKEVLEVAFMLKVDFLLYTKEFIYGTKQPVEKVRKNMGSHIEVKEVADGEIEKLPLDKIFKILIMEDDEDIMQSVISSLTGIDYVQTVQSRRDFLDVGAIGINKGAAIQKVCDLLDIQIEDSIAFGDEDNDLEMLRTAGVGVAMKNGTPSAKKSADIVTLSVEENGFSAYINNYLLSK